MHSYLNIYILFFHSSPSKQPIVIVSMLPLLELLLKWNILLSLSCVLQIILKHCRDTHCHFCFNELPADSVPCTSCSIPLYCSQHCQMQAGGQELRNNSKNHGICKNLSSDLEKYVAGITLPKDSDSNIEWIAEHKHECKGVNWPAVLPPEIVLAGRVMVKSVEQKKHSCNASNLMDTLVIPFFMLYAYF